MSVPATSQTTRSLLAQFVGNQRLIKFFENISDAVSISLPGTTDNIQQDGENTQALASMVNAIAHAALEIATEAAEVPVSAPPAIEAFPINSLYINIDGIDPASTLGYGVWALFGAGRTLVAYAAADPDFGAAGATGGVKSISFQDHPAHTHQVTSNVSVSDHADHTHTFTSSANQAGTHLQAQDLVAGVAAQGTTDGASATLTHTVANPAVTSGNPSATLTHLDSISGTTTSKTLPPFIVVYFWQRTA